MKLIPNNHYLFICLANMARSPAAESWFRNRAEQLQVPIEVSSAGIDAETYNGKRQLEQSVLDHADIIFVMEDWMIEDIGSMYDFKDKPVYNLDIPNVFLPSALDSEACRNMSFEKALEYMEMARKMPKDYHIGRVLFEKILEGKLERILV